MVFVNQREEELSRIPPKGATKDGWPQSVRSIGMEELDNLGVDKTGRLYWDGKPVEIISQHIVLTAGQIIWAKVFAVFGFFAFLGTAAQGFVSGHGWLCSSSMIAWRCVE